MKNTGINVDAQVRHNNLCPREEETSITPARFQQQFIPSAPNLRWVTGTTSVETTDEGCFNLPVIIDLFSCRIIGWLLLPATKDAVLEVMFTTLMQVHAQRKPQNKLLVHLEEGCHYSNHKWYSFLKNYNPRGSTSMRGPCHDHAVVDSFFQLLHEQVKDKIYATRGDALKNIADSIRFFNGNKRIHDLENVMSMIEYKYHYNSNFYNIPDGM